MFNLTINAKPFSADVDADTPLLWVLRDEAGLTGTKFGCGAGLCGACTVLLDGAPVRSCVLTVAAAVGKSIGTIEGLSAQRSHPIQQAWIAESVPQCGYCQSGMVLTAAALLAHTPHPTDAQIDATMTNICRCGTYNRIRRAIHRAAGEPPATAPDSGQGSASGAP
jgi:aerobic-type carbon monoxide dehydrogenase small subunit (CoxS/CutS family)